MEGSGTLECLQLAGAPHHLPNGVVEQLRIAIHSGHESGLDCPFEIGLVAVRLGKLKIATRLAPNPRYDVVGAVLLDDGASERTLAVRLTLAPDHREEVLAAVGEVEPDGLLLCDQSF